MLCTLVKFFDDKPFVGQFVVDTVRLLCTSSFKYTMALILLGELVASLILSS
jgi:hypothetical protein